ncbi:MAG: ferredoxin domain-containing protein, partial [Oscillibacter sp.]|nr:ferredoxin domain-containing protein [Oscillibacter sp.]
CAGMAKTPGQHCAFDDIDLGIALGSAASVAADHRADNRIFYTAGVAAMNLKLLGEQVGTIVAIPVSATNRNIFFFGR